jgi:hypothetical protein
MWEPRRLTTLRASTASYRDSFIFFLYFYNLHSRTGIVFAFLKMSPRFLSIFHVVWEFIVIVKESIYKCWLIYTLLTAWIGKTCFFNAARLYVCTDVALGGAWTVERILFTFGIWEFIHHGSVPGKYQYCSSENRGPYNGSQHTK